MVKIKRKSPYFTTYVRHRCVDRAFSATEDVFEVTEAEAAILIAKYPFELLPEFKDAVKPNFGA